MAASIFVQTAVLEKPRRTRKTHNKVKTGCLTCKIRRKKCDEARPYCNRCTSTGRACDGYEDSAPSSTKKDCSTSPDSAIDCETPATVLCAVGENRSRSQLKATDEKEQFLQLWRPPKSSWFSSDHDYYCFDFFRQRTGPEFAAYFDSSIWRTFMIRACFLHPTVLQAAAAVGAVHRRFELGISKEAFEYCDVSMQQYRKALKCLAQDINSGHPNAPEINMVVSMLLSIFETFQGDYDAAESHMSMGLNQLLKRNFKTTHSESQYRSADVTFDNLQELCIRLNRRAPSLFGSKTQILQQPGQDVSLPGVPKIFSSLEEARDFIITESRWIWHAWIQLELGKLTGFSTQQLHISRLLEWSMAYAEYSKSAVSSPTPHFRQCARLLKVYRETLYLIILTQMAFHEPETGAPIVPLCTPPETCTYHASCRNYAERRSTLNAHFARLLILSECVFDPSSAYFFDTPYSISVDSGIGPPLYMGTKDCRSTKVRHQVTSLLAETDLQKKIWDSLGVYTIAEKLSSIEEHAVVATGAVPASLEPKWMDITCFLEESKILLRYCRQDGEFGGLIWTQEWISF